MLPYLLMSCCWDCLKRILKMCAYSKGRDLNAQLAACMQAVCGAWVQSPMRLGSTLFLLDTAFWKCDSRTCFPICLMLNGIYEIKFCLKESGFGWLVPFSICYTTLSGERKKISTLTIKKTAWDYCEGLSLFYLYWMQNFLCPLTVSNSINKRLLFSLHNVSSVEWEGSWIRAPSQCFLSNTPVALPAWDNCSYLLGFILLATSFQLLSFRKTYST